MTKLGFLKTNDHFILNGKEYRVGHVIDNTNGYVVCIDVKTKKVKRAHIDVEVEEVSKV